MLTASLVATLCFDQIKTAVIKYNSRGSLNLELLITHWEIEGIKVREILDICLSFEETTQ